MIKLMLPSVAATVILAATSVHAADEPKGPSASASEGSTALHDAMMKGMQPMHSMKMTGDVDQDFAAMMIHHHQQAIDMSRAELKNGEDADVRRKAQEIIDASQKDIADLKKWQGGHKDGSSRQ